MNASAFHDTTRYRNEIKVKYKEFETMRDFDFGYRSIQEMNK